MPVEGEMKRGWLWSLMAMGSELKCSWSALSRVQGLGRQVPSQGFRVREVKTVESFGI
jgi:hypothetical protein